MNQAHLLSSTSMKKGKAQDHVGDAFWIDRTEVTNARYRKCVEAGICEEPTICDWGAPTCSDASRADHPVVCVDWNDVRIYCC